MPDTSSAPPERWSGQIVTAKRADSKRYLSVGSGLYPIVKRCQGQPKSSSRSKSAVFMTSEEAE